MRAPKGNVSSTKSANPSVAVPASRSVCDRSNLYSLWVVALPALNGAMKMAERGLGSWVGGRRRRVPLSVSGVFNSENEFSTESMTTPDTVVDDRDGCGEEPETWVVTANANADGAILDFLIFRPFITVTDTTSLV